MGEEEIREAFGERDWSTVGVVRGGQLVAEREIMLITDDEPAAYRYPVANGERPASLPDTTYTRLGVDYSQTTVEI